MGYVSVQDMSDKWGITKRRIQYLCVNNRIPGAYRVGNMWVIPENAKKPIDARLNTRKQSEVDVKKARRELKKIADYSFKLLSEEHEMPVDIMNSLIVYFSYRLVERINNDLDISVIEEIYNYRLNCAISAVIIEMINSYIERFYDCLDDSVSWLYQFLSKKSESSANIDTQFFTEKYMIRTLVDSVQLSDDSWVMDPACGGGNFLLYAYEVIDKQGNGMLSPDEIINHLYGYEIDEFLAKIASFNLTYKAFCSINRKDNSNSIEIFKRITPNVFYPKNETVAGSLDRDWNKQLVIKCVSGEETYLNRIFENINVVFTNPPFRTIKGMPIDQREYLQENYADIQCDMCNAFIDRIMEVLPEDGVSAMVTQNSWMYLDSFEVFRKKVLEKYSIEYIWELGSNAFLDISGEKANVSLVTIRKKEAQSNHQIRVCDLRNNSIKQLETISGKIDIISRSISQYEVLKNPKSRFDLISTLHLKALQKECKSYGDFAVPMQGTSTGDAKNLIDHYWNHIGDNDWVIVSKGGGFSKYEGLNSYCVKWGKEGEYIKNTKGSAIRNAHFFDKTQLVFSDTGTAGLNVRILLPGQIFVASGPGIRINKGNKLAHLGFLNSRFASFYVRLVSPKLTIAAGYISKIPVTENLLNSTKISRLVEDCLDSKRNRLKKRANNYEFEYIKASKGSRIYDMALEWYSEDIRDEWISEDKIENEIIQELELSTDDLQAIDNYIGCRRVYSGKNKKGTEQLEKKDIVGVLGVDCFPKRTKGKGRALGTDGLIEYLSQVKNLSCEDVYLCLKDCFEWLKDEYIDLYLHGLVMSVMKYKSQKRHSLSIEEIVCKSGLDNQEDQRFLKRWIKTHFDHVHNKAFDGAILYNYIKGSLKYTGDQL